MDAAELSPRFLLFGGSGAVGSAIRSCAQEQGWDVISTTRKALPTGGTGNRWIIVDPAAAGFNPAIFDENGPYDAVCWAHGANLSDNVYNVDIVQHEELYKINVVFVLITLKILLERNLLSKPARLCVISSIWQNIVRQDKMSYCITKAALQGLVRSAAIDMAKDGHLINAVLPGVLETPMTRRNLSQEQLDRVTSATPFRRLPTLESVAGLVAFLCSERNEGITGQFVEADLGFSHARII